MNNFKKIAQSMYEDIRNEEQRAHAAAERAKDMRHIADLVENGDMDGVVEFLSQKKHYETSELIPSSASLRFNKPFMSALVEAIVPGATSISPSCNNVVFEFNGAKFEYNFCVGCFSLRADDSIFGANTKSDMSRFISTINLQHAFASLNRYDAKTVQNTYDNLVNRGLIDTDGEIICKHDEAVYDYVDLLMTPDFRSYQKDALFFVRPFKTMKGFVSKYQRRGGVLPNRFDTLRDDINELEKYQSAMKERIDTFEGELEASEYLRTILAEQGFRYYDRDDESVQDALDSAKKTLEAINNVLYAWKVFTA